MNNPFRPILHILVAVILSSFQKSYAQQECLIKEIERLDILSETKTDVTHLKFEYDESNKLKQILFDEDQVIKIDRTGDATKITWYVDEEYDMHFILNKDVFMVFGEEGETSAENADDVYKLSYKDDTLMQVHYSDSGNEIEAYNWEDNTLSNIIHTVKSTEFVKTDSFEYGETKNPFKVFEEISFLWIDSEDILPIYLSLSQNILTKVKTVRNRKGEITEQEHKIETKFDDNSCPIEMHFPNEEVTFKIKYE